VLEIYTTNVGGTYLGNLVNPVPGTWQLRATTAFSASGTDAQTIVTLSKPIHLQVGTQGLCFVTRRGGLRWINPGSTGTPLTYSNSDLTLTMGQAQSSAFVTTPNNPRISCVSLNYVPAVDLVDFTADIRSGAAPLTVNFTDRSKISTGVVGSYEWDFDGDGVVDSTLQNPSFTFTACGDYSPKLRVVTTAGNYEYQWPNLIAVDPLTPSFTVPNTLVAPIYGLSDVTAFGGVVPLPADLTPLGAQGCFVRVDPIVIDAVIADANGVASFALPIPPSIASRGFSIFAQCLCLDLALNPLGLSVSNDVRLILGDRAF
jgi:hypothetical protein